jgi:hypothetical protein
MSELLVQRALALEGTLSTTKALATGQPFRDLARLVQDETLVVVAPRAYVLASALEDAGTPEARHRLRAIAIARSFADEAAASHHSALAIRGLPIWGADEGVVHLVRCHDQASRVSSPGARAASGGVTRVRMGKPYPNGAIHRHRATGTLLVNPALALIGNAMVNGETSGVVAMDEALHRELVTRDDISAWLTTLRRRPGLAAARRALALADHRSESVGESRTRLILAAMPDLPPITPQAELRDESGSLIARVDLLVGRDLVVEFDGRLKYRADSATSTRGVEDVVWREKQREDRIRRTRKVVVRVVWSDLAAPAAVQARIRAGLREVQTLGYDRD